MKDKQQKRNTLAKQISKTGNIGSKLHLAAGITYLPPLKFPRTELEVLAFVEKIRWMGKWLLEKAPTASKEEHKSFAPHMTYLASIITAAASDPSEYRLFARIWNILRFDRNPERHKLYFDILYFCDRFGEFQLGTKERPCDPAALIKHLQKRGHIFEKNSTNQVPRRLLSVCKTLGVVLAARRAGRPKILHT